MSVEVVGWPALARAMAGVPAACERAGERAAAEAAKGLAASVRPALPVRTGRLRASVDAHPIEGGAAMAITAPYAGYVAAVWRALGHLDAAAADYSRRAQANTTAEIARLSWP